jgi:hypothetical protein
MQTRKTTGSDLSTFQLITDFVNNLHECFGKGLHPAVKGLNLYHRLIYTLSFRDDTLIMRHVDVFKTFCVANRDAIRQCDINLLQVDEIHFTNKIFIHVKYFLNGADEETRKIIWEYILAISAYVDPENKTKEVLQKIKETASSADIPDISQLINPEMINGVMGLINGGNLNDLMTNMMGMVSTVTSQLEKSEDPNIKQLLQMVQTISSPPLPTIPEESESSSCDNE